MELLTSQPDATNSPYTSADAWDSNADPALLDKKPLGTQQDGYRYSPPEGSIFTSYLGPGPKGMPCCGVLSHIVRGFWGLQRRVELGLALGVRVTGWVWLSRVGHYMLFTSKLSIINTTLQQFARQIPEEAMKTKPRLEDLKSEMP